MADSAPEPGAVRTGTNLEVRVSTQGSSVREASSRWGAAINSQYCEMDLHIDARQGSFEGLLVGAPIDRLDLTRMRSAPHRVIRSPAMIRSDARDEYLLCMLLRGAATVWQDGRSCTVRDGAAVLVDCDRPFLFDLPTPFEQVIVRVPRAQLLTRLPERSVASATACALSAGSGLAGMLGSFVRQVVDLDAASRSRSAGTLAGTTLDLLTEALAALPGPRGAAEPTRHRELRRAEAALRNGLHDSERTMQDVCQELGVSRRYLQMLFREVGTTPSAWLREARVERARTLLDATDLTVESVAERCGFKDHSHFHRTFRAITGNTPGGFRNRNGAGRPSARLR